jgi:hypothetical protein
MNKTNLKEAGAIPMVTDIRSTMSPEARVIIKGEKLSNGLLAIFSQCEVVKQKAPSLLVREESA